MRRFRINGHRATLAARLLALSPVLCGAVFAQDTDARTSEALNWSVALAERLQNLPNPVISTDGLARLGTLTCGADPFVSEGIFRRAARRLDRIGPAEFRGSRGPLLPASSFTGLWNQVLGAMAECDPGLPGRLLSGPDIESARRKIAEEQAQANDKLTEARDLIEGNPDRAALLASGAMTAADPARFDWEQWGVFLSELRERAPELADPLFGDALGVLTGAPYPSTSDFAEAGKYLFVAASQAGEPDEQYRWDTWSYGGAEIPDFGVTRRSTNPDSVEAYIAATIKMLGRTDSPAYDVVEAAGVGYQVLVKAREMELEAATDLEEALDRLAMDYGPLPGFAVPGAPVQNRDLERGRAVQALLGLLSSGSFEEARRGIPAVDDADLRRQLGVLTDYAEAEDAIARRDFERAIVLANAVRPGVKRALLYVGILREAPPELARQMVDLALRDANLLPAEYRAMVLSAAAEALLRLDADRALTLVNEVVGSMNDARRNPRRARLDPQGMRTVYTAGAGSGTDVPVILHTGARLQELLDSGLRRHNFDLNRAGIGALSLADVLHAAGAGTDGMDPRRLEASVVRIEEEMHRAAALLAITEALFGSQ